MEQYYIFMLMFQAGSFIISLLTNAHDFENIAFNINKQYKVLYVLFGSPYHLRRMSLTPSILVAYENTPLAQKAAANIIAGAHKAQGTLPVQLPL